MTSNAVHRDPLAVPADFEQDERTEVSGQHIPFLCNHFQDGLPSNVHFSFAPLYWMTMLSLVCHTAATAFVPTSCTSIEKGGCDLAARHLPH